MQAFNGDPILKANLITKAVQHKGSSLGCNLGLPEYITSLQITILQELATDLRNCWTERLLTAIPVGADLRPVLPVFLLSLLEGLPPQEGKVKAAIEGAKKVLVEWHNTGQVNKEAGAEASAWTTGTATWPAGATGAAAGAAAVWATWAAIWTTTETAEATEQVIWTTEATAKAATEAVEKTGSAAWADIADKLILSIKAQET